MKIRQYYFRNGELGEEYIKTLTEIISRHGTLNSDKKNDAGVIEMDLKTHYN